MGLHILPCSAPASHCDGFSCCSPPPPTHTHPPHTHPPHTHPHTTHTPTYAPHAPPTTHTLSTPTSYPQTLEHRLSSCSSWLSCLVAMWDLAAPGMNPCLPHWQVDSSPLSHQGTSFFFLTLFFSFSFFFFFGSATQLSGFQLP